ncbi:MAG: phosphatase PAP2 family protein [Bacilli bacterium]|nr:phosphatase PAP2 family protein [Bacilli bacterium]
MKKKRNIIVSVLMTIISLVYVYLVKNFDVSAIGPKNSKVGFSTINSIFIKHVGRHMEIYKLTEVLGYVILLLVLLYGLVGFIELIKRKSIFKIDREIICVGILYVMMISVYVFFEKFIINYRPVLIDGVLEASFPSSHTMLSLCTIISSLIISKKYIKDNKFYNVTVFISMLLLTLVFVGRTISGVHYLSDIVGGVLISITLLSYFYTILRWKKQD